MAIEISVTKDMADKINLPLAKTQNIEPDINHWYAKVQVFNRKRYVLATNTMTRFAVLSKSTREYPAFKFITNVLN